MSVTYARGGLMLKLIAEDVMLDTVLKIEANGDCGATLQGEALGAA